ncbi:MAG: hypothetical protein H7061_12795 [Bdellovibrionaceae bacterium]|nr:hypothetical protein [Bdellovibrio sp.]
MNKLFASFAFVLITYFIYGFYISQFDFNFIPRKVKTTDFYYDYRLAMNIHSNLSIGSEPLSVILAQAKLTAHKFILMTDLNPSLKIPEDSYLQNLGVLQGAKYGYKDSRLIYFSTSEKNLGLRQGESQLQLSDLLSQDSHKSDSLLVLAHPFKSGFNWTGEIPEGLDGLEIVNLKSMSQRSWDYSKVSTIWSLLLYPFNPKLALIRLFQEPTDEIILFDEISQKRKFVAFQGAEASARAIPLADWLIKFPSYERVLSIASNHLLLTSELSGNIFEDRKKILDALKSGQFYICFDALGDSKGFEAYLYDDFSQKKYSIGASVPNSKSMKIYFKLPSEPTSYYEVVLIKNGVRADTLNTFEGIFRLSGPGTYRLQVRMSPRLPLPDAIKWLSWIYTNNFYITN